MYPTTLVMLTCSCLFVDDGRTKPVPRKGHPETFEPADNKCLIRASEGKKKISTVVSALFDQGLKRRSIDAAKFLRNPIIEM